MLVKNFRKSELPYYMFFLKEENLKSLVLGRNKALRCFKGKKIISFIADFFSNKRSWLNNALIKKRLVELNYKIKKPNRKRLLLLENAFVRSLDTEYSNPQLIYFLSKFTSLIQSLDQVIIKTLKNYYNITELNNTMLFKAYTMNNRDIFVRLK
ncbi:Tigger transposable element-derived protein 6 [Cucumispora dikerogammari]|nr:Tigger transposable element-derived protein 6 [Cucumispora dikerogammari]